MSRKALVSFLFFVVGLSGGAVSGQSQPDGQLTIAFDASIATSFLARIIREGTHQAPGLPQRALS